MQNFVKQFLFILNFPVLTAFFTCCTFRSEHPSAVRRLMQIMYAVKR